MSMNVLEFPVDVRLGRKKCSTSCDQVPPVPKSRCWLNYPDLASVHLCPNYVRFSSACSGKKKVERLLWSQTTCVLYFIPNLRLPLAESTYQTLFFFFFPCTYAACKDVHSKTLSGLPVLVIGLSAELAKVPHLAIDRHFPATSADEPARVFDKHLYPNWLWLCGFCGFFQRAVGAYGGRKACDFIGR